MNKQIQLLTTMLRIRMVEEYICELYPEQEMRTPVHLYTGQEAVAAGVCAALKQSDTLVSNHRSHGHYLAKGGDLKRFAAELYGKKTGCSGGRGGSPHLVDTSCGIMGSSAIVAGGIPIGVGAALAASIKNTKSVTAVFFGDGAADQGVLHESLNFAALKKLPVFFILENNQYATASHQSKRQPGNDTYKIADGYKIPTCQIDGNDVNLVYETANKAVENARQGHGPSFIECLTFRWEAHVGPEKDIKKGYPPLDELEIWKKRCPINGLFQRLKGAGLIKEEMVEEIKEKIRNEINAAFHQAKNDAYPDINSISHNVW